jgi:hypothetical protein
MANAAYAGVISSEGVAGTHANDPAIFYFKMQCGNRCRSAIPMRRVDNDYAESHLMAAFKSPTLWK